MFTGSKKDRGKTSQDAYVAALRLMIDGQPDEALRSLQAAVKGGKAPTDAYIRLGNLLRERGDASRAAQIHQSLTVKDNLARDEKVELFLSLAEDYAALGKSDKSVKTLESAVKSLGIRDPRVFVKIAKHYHVVGDSEKAYEALKEARKHDGKLVPSMRFRYGEPKVEDKSCPNCFRTSFDDEAKICLRCGSSLG